MHISNITKERKVMFNSTQNGTALENQGLQLGKGEGWYQMSVLFVILISVLLNATVLIRNFCIGKRYHRNYMLKCILMCNLAISDLLQSTIGYSIQLMSLYRSFKPKLCQYSGFFIAFFAYVSITTSITLNIETFIHICLPWVKERISGSRRSFQLFCICFSWFYALIWAAFPLIHWNDYSKFILGACTLDWDTESRSQRNYIILLFCFCIVVPCILMVVCSIKNNMAIRQMRNYAASHFGVDSPAVIANIKAEATILKLTVIGTSTFLLVWMPYSVFSLIRFSGVDIQASWYAWMGKLSSLCAKMSCITNPLVYAFSQRSFRADLKKMLSAMLCKVQLHFCTSQHRKESIKATILLKEI